ncbi:hypothetical protein GCM10023116_04200 [Kistimonas scapharcae]|uniref:PLD phosphodiesterase domain-containing protein n=1 Tax=Kistimonas scapharcae TaxID=1036133 RepID=A0ABP8UXU7_9GAMM
MEKLLEAVNTLVKLTHPEKLRQLADLIKGLDSSNKTSVARRWQASSLSKKSLLDTLQAWEETSIPRQELAGIILGACSSIHSDTSNGKVELVWTGPETTIVPVRQTVSVLKEVIDKAQDSLFIVSFVITDITDIVMDLEVALERGVSLSILTESVKKKGGTLDYDPGERIAKRLPSASVYYWPADCRPNSGVGSVHAKCAVADESVAFITSANLTGHALEYNMELGTLITGGRIPVDLKNHLNALVLTKVVRSLTDV